MGDNLPAVNLGQGGAVVELVAGDQFGCVRRDDDSVKCWGRNNWGQLGLGDIMVRGNSAGTMGDNLPEVDLGAVIPVRLTAGQNHACALLDDGRLKCWGSNQFGKLGLGNALIIGGAEIETNFQRAARNIPNIDVLPVQGINVYDILRREKLVLTKSAVDALEARFK